MVELQWIQSLENILIGIPKTNTLTGILQSITIMTWWYNITRTFSLYHRSITVNTQKLSLKKKKKKKSSKDNFIYKCLQLLRKDDKNSNWQGNEESFSAREKAVCRLTPNEDPPTKRSCINLYLYLETRAHATEKQ